MFWPTTIEGLGASILIDASVIRLLIVPATMFLLGRYNWWTPRWLDRILPHLDPEGGVVPVGDLVHASASGL